MAASGGIGRKHAPRAPPPQPHRVPVPVRVCDAPPLQLFQRADAERAHEARETRALRVLSAGPPDDLAPAGLGHELPPDRAVYSVAGYAANSISSPGTGTSRRPIGSAVNRRPSRGEAPRSGGALGPAE